MKHILQTFRSSLTPPDIAFSSRKVAISLACFFALAGHSLFAQPTFSTVPPLAGGNGANGITFNLHTTQPIFVQEVWGTFYGTVSGPCSLWYRIDSINGSPNISTANGWQLLEVITLTPSNTGFTGPGLLMQPIPLTNPLFMMAGATYGFHMTYTNCVYTTYVSGQSLYSDNVIHINTGNNVGYGGGAPNPPNHPRQFNGGVKYILANRPPNDAGITAITRPVDFCPGVTDTVKVKIRNYGTDVLTSVTVNWDVDGFAQSPYFFAGTIDTIGGAGPSELEVTLGTYTFTGSTPHLFRAWTSSPNGMLDTVTNNDTATRTVSSTFGLGLFASTSTPLINIGDSAFLAVFSPKISTVKFTEIVMFRGGTGDTNPYPAFVPASTTNNDFVEISNVSTSSVDISGFVFEIYGTGSRPPFTFPSGSIIPAGQVATLHLGTGTDDPSNRYYNVGGSNDIVSSGSSTGIVLKSPNGGVLDAVAFNAFTFTAASGVTGNDWSGPGAPSPSGNAGSSLLGPDMNNSSGWTPTSTTPGSLGSFNPGLAFSSAVDVNWTFGATPVGNTPNIGVIPPQLGVNTYTVTISDSTQCSASTTVDVTTISPTPPVAGFVASTTFTSIGQTVTFTDTSLNLPSSWSWSFSPNTVTYVGGTDSTSKNPQVQFTAIGTYDVSLFVSNAAGNDTETKLGHITVTISYCTQNLYTTGCTSGDRTDLVQIATINNPTSNCPPGAYSDFTNISTQLVQGDPYVATIMAGNFGSQYFAIWIDFNGDGTFNSTDEFLGNTTTGTAAFTNTTLNITIPSNAPLGLTRMRVRGNWNTALQPTEACTQKSYGEVEDYTVEIVDVLSIKGSLPEEKPALLVYPNPVKDQVVVSSKEEIIRVDLMSVDGKLIQDATKTKISLNEQQIDVSSIESGLYLVKVETRTGIRFAKVLKN